MVFLTDMPRIIRKFRTNLIVQSESAAIVTYIAHHTYFSQFSFQSLDDNQGHFIVHSDDYKLEYFTWCLSPYLIRHNDRLEFWNSDEKAGFPKIQWFDVERCKNAATEILMLAEDLGTISKQKGATP
jgi:hypothetical protein